MNPSHFFCLTEKPPYIKKSNMDKFGKIAFMVWMVLAIACFVASFWAPIVIKVLGIVFGSLNLMIIGSWVITFFQERRAIRKLKKDADKAVAAAMEKED